MADIVEAELIDQRVAQIVAAAADLAIQQDPGFRPAHQAEKLLLKFRVQPTIGCEGGHGMRAFDDAGFAPFILTPSSQPRIT